MSNPGLRQEAENWRRHDLMVADEALMLARTLRESGHLDDAIKVGERGLKLAGRKAALGEWLGPVEEAQERGPQALEAWRAAFSERPSLATYQTIKRLAGARWGRLKSGVMATLEKSYDKQPLAEVLLFEKEWDAAIKVADQKGAYHAVVETVAEALVPHRPEWVVRAAGGLRHHRVGRQTGRAADTRLRQTLSGGEDDGPRVRYGTR